MRKNFLTKPKNTNKKDTGKVSCTYSRCPKGRIGNRVEIPGGPATVTGSPPHSHRRSSIFGKAGGKGGAGALIREPGDLPGSV